MNKGYMNPVLILLGVVLLWGSGFIAVEYAIKANIGVSLMLSLRFLIASIIMLVILNKKIITINLQELKLGVLAGIILFLAFYSQTVGQQFTKLSNVAFFTATNVVMVPFISWWMTKKRPSAKIMLLAFLAAIGTAVLTWKNGSINFSIGDMLALLSAFFFASQIAFTEKAVKKINAIKFSFLQFVTVFIISTAMLIAEGGNLQEIDFRKGLIPIIFLGVFCTCFCYFLQTYAQQFISANRAGIIMSLEGFFASILSVVIGIETLTINLIIGGSIIISTAILSNIKFNKRVEKVLGDAS